MTTPPMADPAGYGPLSAAETTTHVLAHVGCRPADRSVLEQRIIDEASSGGTLGSVYVSDPTHPDLPPNVRNLATDMAAEGLKPLPTTPHADDDDDGYTNLEEWLRLLLLDRAYADRRPWPTPMQPSRQLQRRAVMELGVGESPSPIRVAHGVSMKPRQRGSCAPPGWASAEWSPRCTHSAAQHGGQ